MSRNGTPSWLRSQNSEQPRIFGVTGANQIAQKLLFTDLVNTNAGYSLIQQPIRAHEKHYPLFQYILNIYISAESLSILPYPKSLATVLVFPTAGLPVKIILQDTVSIFSCGGRLGVSSTPENKEKMFLHCMLVF